MKSHIYRGAAALSLTFGLFAAGAEAASAAPSHPGTLYVSPSGHASGADRSCRSAAFSSIQAAVSAASSGDTVIVCDGTYTESVTIATSISLVGRDGAEINANGAPYGIGIAASYTKVTGVTVEGAVMNSATNAPGDGIITAGFVNGVPVTADHVTIHDVTTRDNQGAGIDLNSTSYSVATEDQSVRNGIGINVSNDLGAPAAYNYIADNNANNNYGGCGIVLADHTGAGVYDNVVHGNVANNNGLGTASAPDASSGSGIILAGVANVSGNIVSDNTFNGNGHAGVVVHGHAPGTNFSNNLIIGNEIGTNNQRTDYADPDTTGIYLGDASPLTIAVVNNVIRNDTVGIFTAGTVTVVGLHTNTFHNVAHQTAGVPTYAG